LRELRSGGVRWKRKARGEQKESVQGKEKTLDFRTWKHRRSVSRIHRQTNVARCVLLRPRFAYRFRAQRPHASADCAVTMDVCCSATARTGGCIRSTTDEVCCALQMFGGGD